MRLALLVVPLALLGAAIFPPQIGGDFRFAVQQPCPALDVNGVPETPPGLSVGIEPELGGVAILCIPTPTCGPTTRHEGVVKLTGNAKRQAYIARAFSEDACTGAASDVSAEVAYTYPGMKPGKTKLSGQV